jgi:hypothetical protein
MFAKAARWLQKDVRLILGLALPLAVMTGVAMERGFTNEESLFFVGTPVIALYLVMRVETAIIRPLAEQDKRETIGRWKGGLRWALGHLLIATAAIHGAVAYGLSAVVFLVFDVREIIPLSMLLAAVGVMVSVCFIFFAFVCIRLHLGRITFKEWLADLPTHAMRLLGIESAWIRAQFNQGLRLQ